VAAFATGVAMSSPLRGGIVGIFAVLVASSRIYVGVHWPSDIIAGGTVGVVVGVVGKLLIRPKSSLTARVPDHD
jgi:undecaprenyl-diphosphatase